MKPKTTLAWLLLLFISTIAIAQKSSTGTKEGKLNHVSIAFTNSQSAMPFSAFSRLFTGTYHPGIEVSTGFDWKIKSNHDWIQTLALVIPTTGGCSIALFCTPSLDTGTNFPQVFQPKQD